MTLTWQQIHKDIHLHEDGAINIAEPFTGNLVSINLDILEYPDNRQVLGYLIQFSGIAEKRYPLFSAKEVLFFVIAQTDSLKFVPTAYLQELYELEINISNVELSGDGVVSAANTIADIIGLQFALNSKASAFHGHTIPEIVGLQTKLDLLDSVDASKANSADLSVLNTNVTGLAASITNLTNQVNDLADEIDAIPEPTTSGSTNLTTVTANQSLEANKDYFVNTASLVLALPNSPAISDRIRIYNGNFDTKVNHGNANQKIRNNSIDTFVGIDNGLVLKPYSVIELVFVGINLWVSTIRVGTINNQSPLSVEASSTQKTYTPTALEAYTYHDGTNNNLSKINDGNPNVGVMKTSGGAANTFIISTTLLSTTELDRIQVNCGQFNGDFNVPTAVSIYTGIGVVNANLIATFNNINSPNNSVHTLPTPTVGTAFTFEFYPPASNISIRELILFGREIVGGEITVV